MGLITLLRGFKVPIAVLDRFLESHGVEATERIPPHLFRHCDFPTRNRSFSAPDSPPPTRTRRP